MFANEVIFSKKMKKRILLASIYAPTNDMTAFLRAHGPFSLMRDEVEIIEAPQNNEWMDNFKYWVGIDVCFLHRPFGGYGLKVIEAAKSHGVPLWVDHDDDILSIPTNSPHYEMVLIDKKYPSVELSYKESDILTCSGKIMHEELKSKYGRTDTVLIPTGLDDRLLKFKKPFNGNKKISWRGSESHKNDLIAYRNEIRTVVERYGDHEWNFFGVDPFELDIRPKKCIAWPQMTIFKFYEMLSMVNSSVHFVVLEDIKFNRVKSNLAWLDATLCGSICIMPDFEENKIPGIIHYRSGHEFETSFGLIYEKGFDEYMHKNSWDYIQDNLLQSKLNEKRKEIIRNL